MQATAAGCRERRLGAAVPRYCGLVQTRTREALAIAAAWLGMATVVTTQFYLAANRSGLATGRTSTYLGAWRWQAAIWAVWALTVPAVVRLARRVPLRFSPLPIAVHIVAFAALVIVRVVSSEAITGVLGPDASGDGAASLMRPFVTRISSRLNGTIQMELVLYGAVIAVVSATDSARRLRQHAQDAAALHIQLVQAQLHALRLQMQPHFLFNSLHAVGSLVRQHDDEAALATLERLGLLLRRALDTTSRQRVPLEEELETVRLYAAIQQTRFGDFLGIHIEAPPEARNLLVPSLLLQPLVENAVRHGTAQIAGVGRIDVRVARLAERLLIEVSDNGPGLVDGGQGLGLFNVRERLQLLYGTAQQMSICNRPEGGVRVRVEIPAQTM